MTTLRMSLTREKGKCGKGLVRHRVATATLHVGFENSGNAIPSREIYEPATLK